MKVFPREGSPMMMTTQVLDAPAAHPGTSPITAAERELGAFLIAVRQQFGPRAIERAAAFWIEALEAADTKCRDPHNLRRITIAAADRLATFSSLNLTD